jgi:hypothetical protein
MHRRQARWLALLLLSSSPLGAQGVQMIRSAGSEQERQLRASSSASVTAMEKSLIALTSARNSFSIAFNTPAPYELVPMDQAIAAGRRALEAADSPAEFNDALRVYNHAVSRVAEFAPQATSTGPVRAALENGNLSLADARKPIPLISGVEQLVPDVVFVLDVSTVVGGGKAPLSFTVNTNMLGALGDGVFSAIGATKFADYLKDNVSVGTSLQALSGKPSSQASLGLGTASFRKVTLLPTLGVEQMDIGDSRVPKALFAVDPAAGSWSSPVLGTAIAFGTRDSLARRLKCGEFTPVISLGARFPFYYPGNSFKALAALFGDELSKYQKTGGVTGMIAVSLPFTKVDKARARAEMPQEFR